MTRAKITGLSYKPPRTIGIQYSVSNNPLVFGLEMPIEKCHQELNVQAAIKYDYTEKIQDSNTNRLKTLSQNLVGTEFDFELEDELDEIDDEDLLGMEKNEFVIMMIEDLKKFLPSGMIITYEKCVPEY